MTFPFPYVVTATTDQSDQDRFSAGHRTVPFGAYHLRTDLDLHIGPQEAEREKGGGAQVAGLHPTNGK